MNKFFRVCRNILAVIGGLAILAVILWLFAKPYYNVDISLNRLGMMDQFVDSLRSSGPYAKDTTSFSFRIIQDTVRAQEIKDYFQLDTLYTPDADTWTKAVAIGKLLLPMFRTIIKGFGRSLLTQSDCGNIQRTWLRHSTAGCMASSLSNSF